MIIKRSLKHDISLEAKIDNSIHLIAKEEDQSLTWSELYSHLSLLALQSSLQFCRNDEFTILSRQIGSIDLLLFWRPSSGSKDLRAPVLVVGSHHEHDHDHECDVQEHKAPENGEFVVGLRVVVEVGDRCAVVHPELTKLEGLGTDSVFKYKRIIADI